MTCDITLRSRSKTLDSIRTIWEHLFDHPTARVVVVSASTPHRLWVKAAAEMRIAYPNATIEFDRLDQRPAPLLPAGRSRLYDRVLRRATAMTPLLSIVLSIWDRLVELFAMLVIVVGYCLINGLEWGLDRWRGSEVEHWD